VSAIYCVLLPVAGGVLIKEFRRFIKRKKSLITNGTMNGATNGMMAKSQFDAKKNLTSMVLALTGVFLTSRFILTFASCIRYFMVKLWITLESAEFVMFFAYDLNISITNSINLFIYIKFNRAFKKCFVCFFKKLMTTNCFVKKPIQDNSSTMGTI
jgi:hypothetical protein